MNILIVNFGLDGMSDADYRGLAEQIAPAFAEVPGLVSKIWLADPAANVYGGVYAFESRAAVDAYLASDLYAQASATPGLGAFSSVQFDVVEAPTAVTGGAGLAVA